MSKKNLYLGGVLVLLFIIAFSYTGPFKEWKEGLGKPNNFLSTANAESFDRFEVTSDGKTVSISKDGERWKIDGTKDFYLSGSQVNMINDALDEAAEEDLELVSEVAEKKTGFDLDEDNLVLVRLFSGEEMILEFEMGKNNTDFSGTYVSQIDSDKTYLAKANLQAAFGHDSWYNKQIFSFEKEKADKIRFQYPSREFTVERQEAEEGEEGDWLGMLPYRFTVDQEKIDEIVTLLSDLKAQEIPAQSFEGTGLEKNNIIVQVSGDDLDLTIMVGDDNGEDLYYVKRADSDNIYLITKEQRDILEKRISDLR